MMTINEEATKATILEEVVPLLSQGYRFVTMTAVDCDDHFDIYYHFDKNYELFTIRVQLEKPGEISSISTVCFPALIVENEIQDLFVIKFSDLVLDYRNHFLLSPDAPVKPLCHVPGVKVTAVEAPKAKPAAGEVQKEETAK